MPCCFPAAILFRRLCYTIRTSTTLRYKEEEGGPLLCPSSSFWGGAPPPPPPRLSNQRMSHHHHTAEEEEEEEEEEAARTPSFPSFSAGYRAKRWRRIPTPPMGGNEDSPSLVEKDIPANISLFSSFFANEWRFLYSAIQALLLLSFSAAAAFFSERRKQKKYPSLPPKRSPSELLPISQSNSYGKRGGAAFYRQP